MTSAINRSLKNFFGGSIKFIAAARPTAFTGARAANVKHAAVLHVATALGVDNAPGINLLPGEGSSRPNLDTMKIASSADIFSRMHAPRLANQTLSGLALAAPRTTLGGKIKSWLQRTRRS